MTRKRNYQLPGQSEQLSRDIHEANALGVSYGKYMELKREGKAESYRRRMGL